MNFAETRKNMREKVKASLGFTAEERSSEGGDAKPEKMDEVIAEAEKMTEEEAKAAQDDSSLLVILHYARRRFLERGLVGSIDVSSFFGGISNGVCCEVGDDEEEDGLVEDNAKPPNAIQKLAIGGITKIINALERRAKGYKNKSYRANLTLSAGLDVAIPLGFIGMSISCSATVDSLVKYAESKASQK